MTAGRNSIYVAHDDTKSREKKKDKIKHWSTQRDTEQAQERQTQAKQTYEYVEWEGKNKNTGRLPTDKRGGKGKGTRRRQESDKAVASARASVRVSCKKHEGTTSNRSQTQQDNRKLCNTSVYACDE